MMEKTEEKMDMTNFLKLWTWVAGAAVSLCAVVPSGAWAEASISGVTANQRFP